MFDVGFSEIVLIGLIALIILGPKRLPEAARAAGKWVAKARRFVSEVRHDFSREMRNAEIMDLERLKSDIDDTRRAFADHTGQMLRELDVPPASEQIGHRIGAPAARRAGTAKSRPAVRKKKSTKKR